MNKSSLDEKLQELQEAILKLQLLKQIKANNLIIEQENEINHIQSEISELNKKTKVDPEDYLPRKCRFCEDFDQKLDSKIECAEKNFTLCKKKEQQPFSSVTSSLFKLLLINGMILFTLIAFSLLSDVFFKFYEDKIFVFICTSVLILLMILFIRKPFLSLYQKL